MTALPGGATLRRDRIAVLVSLIAVIAAAWVYLLLGAGIELNEMDMGGGRIMVMMPEWTPGYAALVLLMWTVMMAAMMLPGAMSAIFRVAGLARKPREYHLPSALVFVAAYLMVWIGFSIAVTFLQWALDAAGLLTETMALHGVIAASLLLTVGLYQLTPFKQTCLRHCRPPATCLVQDRRQGTWAITREGMRYGVSCLGCCSGLMSLMFVVGVMNVLWMALISFWVLTEKTLPWGGRIARITGGGLLIWGSVLLAIIYL